MAYDYTIKEVRRIYTRICFSSRLSIPAGFLGTDAEVLRTVYNGVGPEQWSSRFRRFVTWLLTFLDAPAMIHDWEFTFQPKTYGAFTVANLRLAYNAALDGHPFSGFAAGILCQCFGWKAYKETRTINKIQKESHMKTVFLAAAAASALVLTGCGHNIGTAFSGKMVNLGYDPELNKVGIQYYDGVIVTGLDKENTQTQLVFEDTAETDAGHRTGTRMTYDHKTGDQITGYRVELEEAKAKASPRSE